MASLREVLILNFGFLASSRISNFFHFGIFFQPAELKGYRDLAFRPPSGNAHQSKYKERCVLGGGWVRENAEERERDRDRKRERWKAKEEDRERESMKLSELFQAFSNLS